MLTHSEFKFTAASSADGDSPEYVTYVLVGTRFHELEKIFGGPPYGATLQNWVKYAAAFNAGKVRAPILIWNAGWGFNDEPYSAYDFFTALYRLGKPVELFFYPNGEHVLKSPFERIASLQRDVDWFRFWMQGYEGNAPSYDSNQYIRWRRLREQHKWNTRMELQGKNPTVEFLRETSFGARADDSDPAPAARDFVD